MSVTEKIKNALPSSSYAPKRITKGPLPDSASLVELFKIGKNLAKTATANAWGILGGVSGYMIGTTLTRQGVTFPLGRWELFVLTYTIAVAIYTIFSRSAFGAKRCLGFAELMFADGQVSATEYKQIRANCLRRAGFIGRD
jgi:hypothetical protein